MNLNKDSLDSLVSEVKRRKQVLHRQSLSISALPCPCPATVASSGKLSDTQRSVSTMLCAVEYGQSGSAILPVHPPKVFPTPASQSTPSLRNRGSLDAVQALLSNC